MRPSRYGVTAKSQWLWNHIRILWIFPQCKGNFVTYTFRWTYLPCASCQFIQSRNPRTNMRRYEYFQAKVYKTYSIHVFLYSREIHNWPPGPNINHSVPMFHLQLGMRYSALHWKQKLVEWRLIARLEISHTGRNECALLMIARLLIGRLLLFLDNVIQHVSSKDVELLVKMFLIQVE